MKPRHSFEEHASEARLRVEADSLPELFEEAARGLCELQSETWSTPGGTFAITVRGCDRDALLAAWLNELIALSEIHKKVFMSTHVRLTDDASLEAEIRGAEPDAIRTAVKAATMHGLKIERKGDRWTADVVLDV